MKIKNNPLLKGASGMLGDVIVFRESRGSLIMSNRPKKRENPSVHQLAVKSRFMQAVQYAKGQMLIPEAKAEYETGVTNKMISAYGVAVADFLKGPDVHGVDASEYRGGIGDLILVNAVDNFKVTDVQVEIRSADDTLIEQGEAVLNPDNAVFWSYVTTQPNAAVTGTKVIVTAKDKPNNVTKKEFVLA